MLVTCNTEEFNKAIQTAQRGIASKPSSPVFAGMHIFTQDDKLVVQGMDLNLAISCTTAAQVSEPGEIIVSAKHLSELCRRLKAENVTLKKNEEENTLTVSADNSNFQLLLLDEENYPKFPDFDPQKVIVIEDEQVKKLIKKTIFSCSDDEARPLFTGILVEAKNDKLTFVGTNTHRLAIKSLPYKAAEPFEIIIPAKVLDEVLRSLNSEIPQEVKISLKDNRIMVGIGETVIVSTLIEGKFPDYTRVIPAKFAVTCKVNALELAGAVERVELFSSSGEYTTVKLAISKEKIILTSSNPDVGAGREAVSCITEGESLNLAFNARYLLDIARKIEAKDMLLSMNTSLSPVCVTSEEDPDYIYIVTPVRVVF